MGPAHCRTWRLVAQPLHMQVGRGAAAACRLLLHGHQLLHDVPHDVRERFPLLWGAAAAAAAASGAGSSSCHSMPTWLVREPPAEAGQRVAAQPGYGAAAAAVRLLAAAILAPAPVAHGLAAAGAAAAATSTAASAGTASAAQPNAAGSRCRSSNRCGGGGLYWPLAAAQCGRAGAAACSPGAGCSLK